MTTINSEKNQFFSSTQITTNIKEDDVRELNFRGGFKEFALTLAATIAVREKVSHNMIKVNDFTWRSDEERKNYMVVTYTIRREFDKKTISRNFQKYLDTINANLTRLDMQDGESAYIRLEIDAPSEVADKITKDWYERRLFETALKRTVPGLYVPICFTVKKV